jgi:glutathione synthase/RimK-type ligase-like ATP-grasp enzyme
LPIQRVSSKWDKTKVLLRNKQVAQYIPHTLKYSQDTLIDMLKDNALVYIKPDIGTYGNGVMCVERLPEQASGENVSPERYSLHYGTHSEEFDSLKNLHRSVVSRTQNKLFLIQKGIPKLKYNDRAFDFRVLTQKTPSGNWETTGIVARVGAKNKITTNYHGGGGMVKMMDEVLSVHASRSQINVLERQLYALGEDTARQLQKEYPKLKEIGLDIAISKDLHPWILEVNTLPAIFPFKKFVKNKDIYRRIERYAIAYGRIQGSRKRSRKAKV